MRAQVADAEFAPGRVLAMARAGVSDAELERGLRGHGAGKGRRIGQTNLLIVEVARGSERALAQRLKNDRRFKFAELDQRVAPSLIANDPYTGSQWHLAKVGAPQAWDQSQGAGVTIAILDSGVDATHPDLAARMLSGWNFYDGNSNTTDVTGHGTGVAGAAAATTNNATGVSSIAGQARILPVRISDNTGWATWSTVAQGLTWAADRGARVANISYQGVAGSASVQSAAQYMKNKGGLVVVAAGNTGAVEAIVPTSTMIPVSATDSADLKTSWSSYGSFVALSAPGLGIYSTTRGGGYASWWGTSIAAPVVAGTVALMMAARPTLGAAEIEQHLYATAQDLGAAGRDSLYGYGRVNASAAVAAVLSASMPQDTQPPSAAIRAPLGASTVGGQAAVDVDASDNIGVTRVELRVNGVLTATDSAAPFAFSWDTTRVADGAASLVATAYDAAGNAGASASVSVNVANAVKVAADTTPPVVAITNPLAGSVVSGSSLTVRVSASDDSGTAGLVNTLYIDGVKVASASGAGLSYKWNLRKAARGSHTLQAVARDAAGNSRTSTVQVTR